MKAIEVLMIFAILISTMGLITADSADAVDALKMYDVNGDGIIDVDERVALDVDIEQLRLTFVESEIADRTATDGTIILSTEFRELATTGDHYGPPVVITEVTVVETPITEVKTAQEETTDYWVNNHIDSLEESSETTVGEPVSVVVETKAATSPTMVAAIFLVIVIAGICIYVISKKNDEEEEE